MASRALAAAQTAARPARSVERARHVIRVGWQAEAPDIPGSVKVNLKGHRAATHHVSEQVGIGLLRPLPHARMFDHPWAQATGSAASSAVTSISPISRRASRGSIRAAPSLAVDSAPQATPKRRH
jgi:hypothetical protein